MIANFSEVCRPLDLMGVIGFPPFGKLRVGIIEIATLGIKREAPLQ
jgi:hypothetical protein